MQNVDKYDVVLGLSGGVDSSVSLALLLEQGHRPLAVTMRLQPCDDDEQNRSCCGAGAVALAAALASRLEVPHRVVDLRQEFAQRVLEPAWRDYAAGRTPNPCVECNRRVRFPALAELAAEVGARWLATGHHARRVTAPDGNWSLQRGADPAKDQSYFLYGVELELLARSQFPVGVMTKAEVRRRARQLGLEAAERPESQDMCLDHQGLGLAELLRLRAGAPARAGEFVDEQGRVLGRHAGVHRFTIGQRQGLGLALGRPAWVRAIDATSGRVEVTCDPERLLAGGLEAGAVHWLAEAPGDDWISATAQVRYRQRAVACQARLAGERLQVRFPRPLRAVTPGQALVLYHGQQVLGGGTIERVEQAT